MKYVYVVHYLIWAGYDEAVAIIDSVWETEYLAKERKEELISSDGKCYYDVEVTSINLSV